MANTLSKKEALYAKKVANRKLGSSLEFTTSRLGWQVSAALALMFWFFARNGSVMWMGVAGIYTVAALLQFVICKRITKEVTGEANAVSPATRKLGWLLLPFVFVGDFFLFISGCMLIKNNKNLEYQLSVYSTLVSIFIIVVSMLNLFKETQAKTFWLGIGLYGIYTVLNLVVMQAVRKYTFSKKPDKKFLPYAYISVAGIALGNVFSFLLGIVALGKYYNKNEEVNVEWIDVIRRLFRNYMACIGMFIVIFLLSVSVASNLTFEYAIAIDNNFRVRLAAPSLMYPFGCDDYGRCVFTRIIFGARISLLVGMISTILPCVVGGMLGAIAGYYGGKIDNIIMRCLDVLAAVPGILLAIAIIAALGVSTVNLILSLSIGGISGYARTVRAQVLGVANQEFVEAAKACGAKDGINIFRHIIPNSLAPVIVRVTMGMGSAVLSTSSLSYLGIGVEAHIPEWGNILKAGSKFLESNPYIAIFPGIAIIIIVLSFNFFGDGLRDALDPKLK